MPRPFARGRTPRRQRQCRRAPPASRRREGRRRPRAATSWSQIRPHPKRQHVGLCDARLTAEKLSPPRRAARQRALRRHGAAGVRYALRQELSRVSASGQSRQLAGRLPSRPLAEAVDPDERHPELERRRDVVEEAGGDVHVRRPRPPALERAPVPVRRLVRADLAGHDRKLERHADCRREASMKSRSVFERMPSFQPRARTSSSAAGTSGNTGQPGNERRARLARRGRTEPLERARHDLAVGQRRLLVLDHRLEPVVERSSVRLLLAEDPRQLAPDPGVPVDERAVAVERRPALHEPGLVARLHASSTVTQTRPSPAATRIGSFIAAHRRNDIPRLRVDS